MAGNGTLPEPCGPDLPPPDLLPPEVLAKAEAALANLGGRYISWAEADVQRLSGCLGEIMADPVSGKAALPRLFAISHDMKGQATTFGYPLVTELANRLCRLIEAEPPLSPDTLERLSMLVDAIGQVISGRMEGDGGEAGRRLLDRA